MSIVKSCSKNYDYLIVGAGVFGSVCAWELTKQGYSCLVIDRRNHIAGNCYTELVDGIHVHKYGAHIFHTNSKILWDYVNQFAVFKPYNHTVVAVYKDEVYPLPFNLWTFNKLWGVTDPEKAQSLLDLQKYVGEITNLEQQAKSLVGTDLYNILIKGYTEKQWNKSCDQLPASIIKRIPVRMDWNTSYFNDLYVGIPEGGYTPVFEKMLSKADTLLGSDYFENKQYYNSLAKNIIYTGPIDRLFEYVYGNLEYRSLTWDTKTLKTDNFQGTSVVNYTDKDVPYTRIIEHKWFDYSRTANTVVSYEYPAEYSVTKEPYYPVRDNKNTELYNRYADLAVNLNNFYLGGRLANYVYYDMHQVIAEALSLVKKLKEKK